MQCYWIVEQAEYATDVIFTNPAALKPLYQELLKHAPLCLSAEDVLTFLSNFSLKINLQTACRAVFRAVGTEHVMAGTERDGRGAAPAPFPDERVN